MPETTASRTSTDAATALVRPMLRVSVLWIVVMLALPVFLHTEDQRQTGLAVVIVVFFAYLLARLALAFSRSRTRRPALLTLSAGIVLWAAGAATVAGAETAAQVTFPSASEFLFLASYGGLAAFLLLDVPRRRATPTGAVWLETVLICGGVASLAGVLVVVPIAARLGDTTDLALLLAVLYPLIDLALAVLVLAQALLGARRWSVRTGFLALAFAVLAAADSSFALTLGSNAYASSATLDMLWGACFALIVLAACTAPDPVPEGVEPGSGVGSSRLQLSAAGIALLVLVLARSGGIGWLFVAIGVVTLVSGGARMALALREARGAAEALRLSRTDELTGLPNRRAVMSDLDADLAVDQGLGFMLLDLDGFKEINDSVGHPTGDALLVMIARRLEANLGGEMTVARLGGDEFALLVPDDDPVNLLMVARDVCDLVAEPFPVDGLQLTIQASVGITQRQAGDTTATDLLRRADVAMYEAKATRSGALLYDPTQDDFSRDRLRRTEELRRGIRQGELVMWYQPQVDAATQQISAVEALVRWQHPRDGLLTPVTFMADARRYGLMTELSLAVMRMVVADTRDWAAQGFDFRVSMNCAPPELLGGTLLPELYAELERMSVPPNMLVIEVTEDSFMSDPERARERLLELRDHDIQVAIDDYGTGFSSLSYLRDLPVQELKMDRSFVATMRSDARSRVIVDTTRQMAHAMGLRVVAEGVEDAATAAALVAMDIDMLQGHHLTPPLPAADLPAWVRSWSASLSDSPSTLPETSAPRPSDG